MWRQNLLERGGGALEVVGKFSRALAPLAPAPHPGLYNHIMEIAATPLLDLAPVIGMSLALAIGGRASASCPRAQDCAQCTGCGRKS